MASRHYPIGIWICFAVRLFFYCAVLPMREGYDEWAHFAVIRRMAFEGEWLVARERRLPSDVKASFAAGPMPWTLRGLFPGSLTEEEYWKLSPAARAARTIPDGGENTEAADGPNVYEALHPPLYYWVMSVPMRLLKSASLPQQVWVLRILSAMLTSLTAPLVFLVARGSGAAAVVGLMPGFAIDLAGVGNECAAVPIFTLLAMREGGRRHALLMGTGLGVGLLTKAYFLTTIPALLLLLLARRRPQSVNAAIVCAAAVTISGWWLCAQRMYDGDAHGAE